MKQNIVPIGDRVLVKPLKEEKETKTGIIIPDTASEKPEQGEVIAVGEGRSTDDGKVIPMKVKKGDKILFSKYGPDEFKIEGEEFYILREDSILAIVK